MNEYLIMNGLTHFSQLFHLYTPLKRQKTFGFLTFSGVIELEHWAKMVKLMAQLFLKERLKNFGTILTVSMI